mgnify:CR=1 FL=1
MLPLTSQERKVIIFILCSVILGIGFDFFKKKTHRKNLISYEQLHGRLFDKVNVNRATFSQLTSIPGMGEKLAWAIIHYRKEHCDFSDIEALNEVKGIKEKKLEQLKKYVVVTTKGTP